MIIDFAKIYVKAGDGGPGAVAFRREKFVAKGGPSGGNGGKGGDIIFVADNNLTTLLDFKYRRKSIANNGGRGEKALRDGKDAENIVIKVPVGTVIKSEETQEVLVDLDENGKEVVFLKGGIGGKGNSNFATATNQAPRYAQPGIEGKEMNIILELKLLADVGLVGFPNAGKSTFISVVSAARPKIADYPFTTLEPNLGIVKHKDYRSFVIADIPGIIEGAHVGKGLGHKFLKHIERTKVLLILIDSTVEKPQKEYDILLNELIEFSDLMKDKKRVIVFTKSDLLTDKEKKKLQTKKIKNYDGTPFLISSVTQDGTSNLIDALWNLIEQ
ncbi:MAG: GTPase ObgE [Bacteroidetes bacterium]|nr:GTPase ObgE [Bacteroidota bacterium]MBU1114705.1 GTPase ObgE [Bacteroidota bacterium]MBU1798907.1 GTPase ObgE [Bacteroidota bacterium]